MTEFTIDNLGVIQAEKVKENYLGEYIPENFWEDYGKYYLRTFVDEESKKFKKDIFLNLKALCSRIKELSPKSVLEIGCGFGRCFPFILENVLSVERLTGVELSQTMIENSKMWLESYPKKNKIQILQAKAQNLPFKDKEFDLVYTHVCLTHIPPVNIPQCVNEIKRVAKEYIIHIERFHFPYEHSNPHRWSHLLVPLYSDWDIIENDIINEKHFTNVLVLKAVK